MHTKLRNTQLSNVICVSNIIGETHINQIRCSSLIFRILRYLLNPFVLFGYFFLIFWYTVLTLWRQKTKYNFTKFYTLESSSFQKLLVMLWIVVCNSLLVMKIPPKKTAKWQSRTAKCWSSILLFYQTHSNCMKTFKELAATFYTVTV